MAPRPIVGKRRHSDGSQTVEPELEMELASRRSQGGRSWGFWVYWSFRLRLAVRLRLERRRVNQYGIWELPKVESGETTNRCRSCRPGCLDNLLLGTKSPLQNCSQSKDTRYSVVENVRRSFNSQLSSRFRTAAMLESPSSIKVNSVV
jgi:hypothetical protein